MKKFSSSASYFVISVFCLLCLTSAAPPQTPGGLANGLRAFVEIPAVPGHEQDLARQIRSRLSRFTPQADSLGNVYLTLGAGAPHRLIVAPMDEPGYVVSGITEDGYLRVQRLPQPQPPHKLFDQLYGAQPVKIRTRAGPWVSGVVAGLSIHLQPGRLNPPVVAHPDEMYIDIGASGAAEVRKAGVALLDPVALERELYEMGFGKLAAPAIGDRFGVAALVELAQMLDPSKVKGTLTIAFVAQQWTGARGLVRLLEQIKPDEMIYVGRLRHQAAARAAEPGASPPLRVPLREPGSGVLIGVADLEAPLEGLAGQIKQLGESNKIPMAVDFSAPVIPSGYLPVPPLPERFIHLGIAVAWPATPAEVIDLQDLQHLVEVLEGYAQGSVQPQTAKPQALPLPPPPALPFFGNSRRGSPTAPVATAILETLVETYGVSGHEAPVREAVKRLLPSWAKPETDPAGNLVLRWAASPAGSRAPKILFVAHLDEIGFEVRSIADDGRLQVEWRGTGSNEFFIGHPMFVITASGIRPGMMELPPGWQQPAFAWPQHQAFFRVDVGARTPAEVEQLGIKAGDSLTVPKKYRRLVGARANGRSFDDRVGCTALIAAAWALGPNLKGRDVTFVWSIEEELRLNGAAALAQRLAQDGRVPDYVFAIDTFVSSDSPLESKRFADARLGRGFVVRAVDNSNIVPLAQVDGVVRLASAEKIDAQYGVTGGGNDGAAFLRFGATDVALGWPLRYSHSPGEVVDTRDVESLARIVAALARGW